jgi:hypothetical protein
MMQGGMTQGGTNMARVIHPQLPETTLGGYVFRGSQSPEEEKDERETSEPEGKAEE